MSATPKPIKWRTGRFGSMTGSVDGLDLFDFGPSTSRTSSEFVLTSCLPFDLRSTTLPDSEGAKAKAAEQLAAFIARLTV